MHNHSKHYCTILKAGLMIRGLPSLARLALGPSGLGSRSWATFTLGSSLSAPSSPPSGTSVRLLAERSTRRCKCKIYSTVFTLITYEPYWQSRGVFVGHIHLDKNTISILFQKEQICNSIIDILFIFWERISISYYLIMEWLWSCSIRYDIKIFKYLMYSRFIINYKLKLKWMLFSISVAWL